MTSGPKADGASAVMMVAIRVAGQVPCDLGVSNLLSTRMVTIQLGGVLCRVSESATATHVRKHWGAAGIAALKLPRQVDATPVEANRELSPVGVVARLIGYPGITATVMPGGNARTPAHLRLQVGPIVWQILDQAAYESMAKVWHGAEKLLRLRP